MTLRREPRRGERGSALVNLQVIRDAAVEFAVPDPDMEAATAQILANLAG
ncbi:MAG TPA: hypothetical protein VLN74_16060 [Ilumatobacteraceae bacterium]|nr:hypothetical protein [Ilumatobacteraceae bacterium]